MTQVILKAFGGCMSEIGAWLVIITVAQVILIAVSEEPDASYLVCLWSGLKLILGIALASSMLGLVLYLFAQAIIVVIN